MTTKKITPQKLTMKQVLKSTRKALTNKSLQAQNAGRHLELQDECAYRTIVNGKEYNCVVGSALTKKTKDKAELLYLNKYPLSALVSGDCVIVPESELTDLMELQKAHDAWASSVGKARASHRKNFYNTLKAFEQKYNVTK